MSNNVHEHACQCCKDGLCTSACGCWWFNAPYHPSTEIANLRMQMARLRGNLIELGRRLDEAEKREATNEIQ